MSTSDAVAPEIEALLDEVPSLAARPRAIERLPGGLTNVNLKVTTPEGRFVARLSSDKGALLAIDREAEYRNSRSAAATGVAPEVVDYLPGRGVLVVRWIDGRTFGPDDLQSGEHLDRIAEACRALHAGPRFVNDFDMFAIQRRYLDLVLERGFRLPRGYLELMPDVDRIASALAVHPAVTVPCNNDLLAANFIDDGERIWLIDYEYSGNNDPAFELGNIWSESFLSLDQLEELLHAYHGTVRRHDVARARLLGLMSKYGWTLWGAIQDSVSDIDFDFWSWAMEHYERAEEEFAAADFDGLLDDAAGAG
jgi:thiamine kinase-like enzyme